MTGLGAHFEGHHWEHREGGEFVLVPERALLFREAIASGKRLLDVGRSGAPTRLFLDGNTVVGLDVDRGCARER